jgi:starch-binding outer membrane protein, SusD/RagB family
MKIKFILYSILFGGLLTIDTSCSKSFLEVDPIAQSLEINYYKTPDQIFSALVAIYDDIGAEAGYGINWYANKLAPLNAACDECYAGGGSSTDMQEYQVWDNYTLTSVNGPSALFWEKSYKGISRANVLLSKLENPDPELTGNTSFTPLLPRYIAEAKALRAYFYFDLVRLFKNVPLSTAPISTSEMYNIEQAKPEAVFGQIEKDLSEAIVNLPSAVPANENGRITKGAAMAMLGKVILWQNNASRMSEAASWFNKVNTSGVYSLLPNYGDIFSPANKFNKESILEIVHTSAQKKGDWDGNFRANVYVIMVGPRSYSAKGDVDADHTYVSGWSFNPIIKAFAASIHNDPRYKYTVADLDSLVKAGKASYLAGYNNTGFFIQKYAPLLKWKGTLGSTELNFPNDYIEIRLADTYLMEAEASVRANGNATTARAQALLDAVRARVGLPSVSASLDNIYNERKLELATEGHRWFDLVRTGKAASVLAFKGFKTGTHELLPIPYEDMINTKMVQNPGYNQ